MLDIRYMRYETLVREYQNRSLVSRIGRGLRSLVGYVIGGTLWRLPLRTIGLILAPHIVAFTPILLLALLSDSNVAIAVTVVLFSGLAAYLMLARYGVILAADLFAFMQELATGTSAAARSFETRVIDGAKDIPVQTEVDSLVIGHSLGGPAAIRAAAELLDRLPPDAELNLLTLGSVHGIILAQAGEGRDRLAQDIGKLCQDRRVFWVDVSSPRDAFCLPLIDPLLLIGDEAQPGMSSPRIISAQLRAAPPIPGDRRTVFAAMRRHMGYLLQPSQGSGFDYVDIVTSPLALSAQFHQRGNSPKARMWKV